MADSHDLDIALVSCSNCASYNLIPVLALPQLKILKLVFVFDIPKVKANFVLKAENTQDH